MSLHPIWKYTQIWSLASWQPKYRSQKSTCPDWANVRREWIHKLGRQAGDLVDLACWHPASLSAHRASALRCVCGQMPWHLDPGLESNHQHVLAQRGALWARQPAGPGALSGADCWPWWSLISIIHYPKSGSHGELPPKCTLRKRWRATCEGLWCQDSRGMRWCKHKECS